MKHLALARWIVVVAAILVAYPVLAANSIDVNASAAMEGSFGLEAIADGTATNAFVQDDSPANETIYRASFMFDPNSMTMITGGRHIVFSATADSTNGNKAAITLQVKRKSSGFAIRAMSQVTAGTQREKTGDIALTDAPHTVQLEWQVASGSGVADGYLRLTVDGTTFVERTNIRSFTQSIKNAKLGHLASSVDPATVGSHYFDDFQSFRTLAP